MNQENLQQLLRAVAEGRLAVDEAAATLKHMNIEDLGYAHIDHHRCLRKGFPEVIFGQGKTVEQINGILGRMLPQENVVLVTRLDQEKAHKVLEEFPKAVYHADARLLICRQHPPQQNGRGLIVVMCAGTSDIPVAQEAYLTAQAMGHAVKAVYDVGVAGIHRLFNHWEEIKEGMVFIVVAGMEGALPSVVAGLVSRPIIAVPTSIGYGTSFGGLTALFAMLNSCSSNVAVVNIDNGFGAGYMAASINSI